MELIWISYDIIHFKPANSWLLSEANTLMSYSLLFLAAKFASVMSLINKNKSFMKVLNETGPNTEHQHAPSESIWKLLFLHPVFLRFKYEYTKVTASSDKPYAWSVATSKFWGIQQKTLDRSIKTVHPNV